MNEEITLMDRIKKLYRPVGKITDYIPLSAAITFILVLVSSMVGLFITAWLLPPAQTRSPAMQMFAMYFNTIGAWVVALLLILILPGNHKMLKAAGPGMKGNTLKWILYGILIGFGANTFCVLMSILFKDISLSFSQFSIGWCLALFFAVMIQSGSEELLCRLYMFQKLRRRYKSPWVAVIVNSVFFGALHMGNQGANFFGIAQCVIFGFLASILVWKYKSFWGAVFAHTAWNFTQNILFGLPNSGVVPVYSFFRLDAASGGLFFDPGFGVEGSPGACLLLTAITIGLLVYAFRNNLEEQDIWKEDEERILAEQAQEVPSETA